MLLRMMAPSGWCYWLGGLTVPMLVGSAALAQEPRWEIGAVGVGVSQAAYPGADQQIRRVLAVPYFLYRGEYLRADRETVGLRAFKSERVEVDVGVAGAFGSGAEQVSIRRDMPKLGTLVEFGPRVKSQLGRGPGGGRWQLELPLRGVFDLTDRGHHRGWALEPRLLFERTAHGGWRYSAAVGAILADTRLAATFYGVDAAYATPERPAYRARSGLVAWRAGSTVSYELSPDWRVFGAARVDYLRHAVNRDSPLVRTAVSPTLAVGLAYTWQRARTEAVATQEPAPTTTAACGSC
jgi:outer membrane protein